MGHSIPTTICSTISSSDRNRSYPTGVSNGKAPIQHILTLYQRTFSEPSSITLILMSAMTSELINAGYVYAELCTSPSDPCTHLCTTNRDNLCSDVPAWFSMGFVVVPPCKVVYRSEWFDWRRSASIRNYP
jgi:hypothetical protein